MSNKTMKVLAAVTGLGLIAACSTLPDNSRPEAIRRRA